MTINGTLTFTNATKNLATRGLGGLGAGGQQDVDLNDPPYAIHNGAFTVSRSVMCH